MEYLSPRQDRERMGFKDILPLNHLHIIYVAVHLIALSIIWSGFSWLGISLCLVSYFGRHLGLVVGYHRYFAHRSFKTSRLIQFFLALHGSLCAERGPLWWGQTHRLHHRYSDTPNDIHSPHYQGFLYSHSGWFLNQKFFRTNYAQIPEFAKFPELFVARSLAYDSFIYVGGKYVLLLRMGRFRLGILFEHRDDLAYNSYHSIIMSLFQWLSKLPDIRQ